MKVIVRLFLAATLLAVLAPAASAQIVDLSLTKTGPDEADAGDNVTYVVSVSNAGPDSATDVTITDNIPEGMTFVSATHVSGSGGPISCVENPPPFPGQPATVVCTGSSIPAGGTMTIEIVFNIPAQTPDNTAFGDTACVSTTAFDENEENNCGSATTTVLPPPQSDFLVTKTGPASAGADTNVEYTIQLTNAGPDAADVELTDTLPGDMTFVSIQLTGQALVCSTPAANAGGTITCNASDYPAGASTTITLTGHIPSGTPPGTEYTNTATASSVNDSTGENNVAFTSLITSETDISIVKSGPGTAVAGEEITYTITVQNVSGSFAEGVGFIDELPAGTTFVSLTQDTGPLATCNTPDPETNGTVTCGIDSLAPAESAAFSLVIEATQSFTNTATASSSSFDTNLNNNESSVATTVTPAADVSLAKTAPASVNAGQNITFTLTVNNAGPSPADNVEVTDTLPANTTFVSASAGCTGTTTVTCDAGTIAANGSAVFTITALVSPGATGTISNTANATTTTFDPDDASDRTSTSNTTVTTSADLGIDKSGPATATAGATISYTLTATNSGPSDAANVVVSDTLPAGTTFVSMTQETGPTFACNAASPVSCTIASFASGATATFTLVASISPSYTNGTMLTNTASIDATTADPNGLNDSDSTSATIAASADLRVTKTAPPTINAGETATYTITVENLGSSDAANVVLSDTLPPNTSFVSITQNTGPTFTCNAASPISCTRASFASGATATFTLVVNVASSAANASTITNTASVSSATPDPVNGNNSSDAPSTVAASADLSVTKTGPATGTAGEAISYTIAIANAGPADAVNVTLSDATPANTVFISITPMSSPSHNCTTPAPGTPGTVTCTFATLADGATANFTLVLFVSPSFPNGTMLTNSATIASGTTDPANGNNMSSTSATIATSADVRVAKTTPAAASANSTITYTITAENLGPSDAANVTLTDVLPPATTFNAMLQTSGPTFNCTTPPVGTTGTVTCTIASFADNAIATFSLIATIPGTTPNGTVLTNNATITTTTADPSNANNTSTTNTTVSAVAELQVTKQGPPVVAAGTNILYTITVTNFGSATASNVVLTDTLPAGITFVSLTQNSGPAFTCATNGNITCTRATMAASTSASFILTLNVPPTATGSFDNRADVSSDTPDPNPLNNTSTSTAAVTPGPTDLTITKTSNETRVAPGSTVTFTIVARNNGPAIAYDVEVIDILPSNMTFVSVNTTQGTCTGTSAITCELGQLMPLAEATITLTVTVGAGVATNSATISAANSDTDIGNNGASASITASGDAPLLSPIGMLLLAMSLATIGWFAQRMR